ncbi:MAG: MMPL family transporter [Actinomycetota bacterium]
MLERVTHLVLSRPRAVLAVAFVSLVVSFVVGGTIADHLGEGGFDDPGSDSVRAREELDSRFGAGAADLVVLATIDETVASVNDAEAVTAGIALTDELAAIAGTDDVVSYWSTGDSTLRSEDGRRALVLLRVPEIGSEADRRAVIDDLAAEYRLAERGPLTVELGGRDAVFDRMSEVIEDDLALAEIIAIPLTFLVLIVVFGGVVAASLPVGVGVLAALGAFTVLRVVTTFADVSIFALNLITALGLGLAIDYSLLMVNRYREERGRGGSDADALRRTIRTAGRTILFSGLTVAISLGTLLVFPLTFLRSFAWAGLGVVGFAMAASIVVLPAVLIVLGPRIDALTLYRRPVGRHAVTSWTRLARTMTRRPWPVIALTVPLLMLTALPFLGVEWGEADDRALPADDPVRRVSDVLRDEFATAEADAFPVIGIGSGESATATSYAIDLSLVAGVARVDTVSGSFVGGASVSPPGPTADRFATADAAWFNVVPEVEPISAEGEALIAAVRAVPTPYDEAFVGGATAAFVDTKAAVLDNVWQAGVLIGLTTFVLLLVMFRSVLVAVKAIVLNLLSLGATFGVMIWIFQEGNGADVLGVTATGQTDITTPILMFCIAFGLSMDYEVFLLARIKEEWDRTGDNLGSIVAGLSATGRLVSNAAVLLSITFLAFALTSSVSTIVLFGLGLAVAVLVDAFIVRMTLVPALLAVAGRLNWWAPRPVLRVLDRLPAHTDPIDLRETVDLRDAVDLREPAAPEGERPDVTIEP